MLPKKLTPSHILTRTTIDRCANTLPSTNHPRILARLCASSPDRARFAPFPARRRKETIRIPRGDNFDPTITPLTKCQLCPKSRCNTRKFRNISAMQRIATSDKEANKKEIKMLKCILMRQTRRRNAISEATALRYSLGRAA